jgi:hypothetical protein
VISLGIVAASLMLGVAACSDDGGVEVTTSESAPAASTTSVADSVAGTEPAPSSTEPQPVIDVVHQPGEGEFDGALDDVEFTCTSDGSTWTAQGSATNSSAATADYRIFMAFLDSSGETVALIEEEVTGVPAGESADWSVQFASDAADLDCVPRVERRPA